MEKKILEYKKKIDCILEIKNTDNIDKLMSEHLVQIHFFQHERLIHLIVTMTFALLTIITLGIMLIINNYWIILLFLLFLLLLIPYIRHYYILENSIQKMYDQYDKMVIIKKIEKDNEI